MSQNGTQKIKIRNKNKKQKRPTTDRIAAYISRFVASLALLFFWSPFLYPIRTSEGLLYLLESRPFVVVSVVILSAFFSFRYIATHLKWTVMGARRMSSGAFLVVFTYDESTLSASQVKTLLKLHRKLNDACHSDLEIEADIVR